MRKRFLSLLCVLALCLALLPVTALAEGTAPQTLYVGSTTITAGYWKSSDGGTTWTNAQQSDSPSGDSYIHYNGQGTLELHNVTIQGADNTGSPPYGAGIYALCSQGQPVALTIKLIGENTITGYYGIYVNAEISADSNGTDASLTITSENNGSLEVSGSNYGIFVKSGTGNASLNIEKATVTSSTDGEYAAGVNVQSSANATGSPNISLSVNGGSLTASGTGNSDGILFYVGHSQATGATTSLTITDHAIVDARNGGISASRTLETLPTPTPTGNNSSGIVFDDKNGTVYGNVTLDESLTINQGETLTVPDGSKLDCNNNLTNKGTILVETGGTVSGNLSGGTGVTTPSITAQPTDQTVTEGQSATFTVEASAGSETPTYQWQQKTAASGSDWTDISQETSASYTISSTTTSMSGNQYRCVVKSASGVSVISQAATLTVQAKPASVPVTGVTLDKTTLELFTGGSATLTATVQPDDATNKNVTWQSDNANVATVQNGTVNAVGAGEATITVTTEDGKKTATCKVTVTQSEYSISADTTALNFGSAYTGYTQPAAQMVTITNTGNQQVTVTLPTANDFIITAGTGFTNGSAAIEPDGTSTFTVQPKAGLAVGTYSENITISDSGHVTLSIPATFTVRQYSSGGGTPTKTPSQQATDKIESAKAGDTVTVNLTTGNTKLNKEVFEKLSGKDVTLEIKLPGGIMWTVNGQDIPANADLTDLDMGVSMDTSTIPVNLINAVTGEAGTVQLTLKHNGEFGFKMMLTAPVGVKNAGLWANLYHYDEDAGKMVYQAAALVDEDGNVALPFDHASQYALVLDSKSHDLPFTDLAADAWYTDAVAYVYRHDLMAGYGENLFGPDDDLSRAQLCQIIYNMEGQPATSGSSVFTDVADSAWYADAVTWAASQGIVGGYGGGLFGPEDNITREQLASILYRYAQAKDYDTSVGENTNILSYTDALEISEYAIPAMQWACGAGIMEGNAGYLTPQGDATRAQVATMLMRFCENYATTK